MLLIRALVGLGRRGCTTQELAAQAGLGLSRARVITAVLENMDLLRRSGSQLSLRRAFSEAELAAFLETFEARHTADRERIQNMMRYGQTTRCRMQFLREYFGEPAGQPCQHCDNCQHPLTPLRAIPAAGPGR